MTEWILKEMMRRGFDERQSSLIVRNIEEDEHELVNEYYRLCSVNADFTD